MSINKALEIKILDHGEQVGIVFLSMYENRTRTFVTYPSDLFEPELILSDSEGNVAKFKMIMIKHSFYGNGIVGDNNIALTIEKTKNDRNRLAVYVVRT